MKSAFGMLLVLFVILAVIGTGFLIWNLSANAEFSRKDAPAAVTPEAK